MSKGGSKLVTGIISFLLGFLFAIIVEIGAVFGVYWYVVNNDINTIMAAIGLPNTNDRFINTDKENGGVTNLKELLAGVQGLVFENGELAIVGKSFDEISHLIPATQMLLNTFYGFSDEYIELDHEAFQSNPLMNLAQVLSESVMNIKTGALLEKLNMDTVVGEEANPVVKALIAGSETDYATVVYSDGRESTLKLPVMYDYYILQEGNYSRVDYDGNARPVDDISAFPQNLREKQEDLLTASGKVKDGEAEFERYALYFVPCRVTEEGISEAEYVINDYEVEHEGKTYKFQTVSYGEDTDFIAVEYNDRVFEIDYDSVYTALNSESTDVSERFTGYSYYRPYAENYYYTEYSETLLRPMLKTVSGKNYFRNSSNKMVQLDALTLNDLVDDAYAPLNSVLVTEVVTADSKIGKVFGTTTLGALLNGEADDILNNVEISKLLENVAPDNKIMSYMVFKVSALHGNGDGTYRAIYDEGGQSECEVTVRVNEKGYISEVRDNDGKKVPSVGVNDLVKMAESMPVTVLMDVDADQPIMVYLGYGVSGLVKAEEEGADYSYVGKIKLEAEGGEGEEVKTDCYIATEKANGKETVTSVWYYDGDGEKVYVHSTKVNKIADRVSSFADELTISDVLKLDGSENMMLQAIKDTEISKLNDRIGELTVKELFTEEEINKSSMLRQLSGKKLTELSTAIDELLIQNIYFEEVYRLPKDVTSPMEVIDFNEDYEYFVTKQVTDADSGAKWYEFEKVERQLTREQFDNRGNTAYYTYAGEEGEGAQMKIVGFNQTWLYYVSDGSGGFELTEKNCADLPDGTEKDNLIGKLTQEDYDNRGDTTYYAYGTAQGMWKLVLSRWYTNDDGDEVNTEKAYTMNNFNNMVNQCASNIYKARLGELQDAGLIAADVKGKTFTYPTGSAKLEDLTLQQLIEIVLSMSTKTA